MARLFRSMRNIQLWISLSLGSLMIFVLIFAFIARKPLCIDSKIVERIDSISASGTASAYRCGLHKHVDYDEKLTAEIKDLGRRLQVLEKYFDWIGGLQSRISLTVIADSNDFYRIQDHQVFIGDGFLRAPGQLEKTLLKVWISERASGSLLAQPLVIESLTDLLYFSLAGDFNVQDVSSKISLDEDLQARWPRVLNSFSGYCRSPWRMNEDISRCERDKATETLSANNVDLLSLRPLLTQSLINSYQKMRSAERIQWMLDLSQSLGGKDFSSENKTPHEMIKNFVQFFSENQKFGIFLETEIKERGFSEIDQLANRFDYLVFADDLKVPWLKPLAKANQKSTIAIEHGGIQVANEESGLEIHNLAPLVAQTGIIVQCGDIDFNKVKSVSKRVEKLLYIKWCEGEELDILPYFEKGATALAFKNRDLQFIEFHTPSLRLALRRTPSLENVSVLQAQNIQARLFDYLGWQEPQFDILLKAYRAKSVIEAVDWYRL